MLYCPQCAAEYREGYSSCSDCHVLLGRERPSNVAEAIPAPGDPNEDPFCSFWKGTDSRVHAEICLVLDEAEIPHKTLKSEDRLFNRMDLPRYELGVPASLYEKAEEAIGAAFSSQPLLRDTDGLVPEALHKQLDFDRDEPELELPSTEHEEPEERHANSAAAVYDAEWAEENATSEIWSGPDQNLAEMIEMSLRENDIHTCWQESEGKRIVFALPAEESRAREIVREIVEATPRE